MKIEWKISSGYSNGKRCEIDAPTKIPHTHTYTIICISATLTEINSAGAVIFINTLPPLRLSNESFCICICNGGNTITSDSKQINENTKVLCLAQRRKLSLVAMDAWQKV